MNKRETRACLSALGALALALMLGMPAHAGKSEEMTVSGSQKRPLEPIWEGRRAPVTHSVKVAVGDLNLASRAGTEKLYVRLRHAAKAVCEPRNARYPEQRRAWGQCADTALDNAVAASGIERVVAMHRAATGRDMSSASQLAGSP